jgi:putative FmdB family regulatory protein
MPVYEYQCKACGHEFEREQRISDPPVKKCPSCNALKARRQISRTSFVLKGGGWYSDLYGSAKPSTASTSENASGSESKPAADAPAATSASDGKGASDGKSETGSKSDSSSKGESGGKGDSPGKGPKKGGKGAKAAA